MKIYNFLSSLIFIIVFLLGINGSGHAQDSQISLVGSTPADSAIKALMLIPQSKKADFMRWELTINNKEFTLFLEYGESKPNTNGFINDGDKLFYSGNLFIQNDSGNPQRVIYNLIGTGTLLVRISLIRISDNIFHLLMPDKSLFVGNGGWSYTLNRKNPVIAGDYMPSFSNAGSLLSSGDGQLVFEGRTPCGDLVGEYNIDIKDCYKLKWMIVFYYDKTTGQPSTYVLKTTFNRSEEIKGTWTIKKVQEAIIIQLDSDKPEKSFAFLAADENVLYFLSKDNKLFTGNNDFSYTLNRRTKISFK